MKNTVLRSKEDLKWLRETHGIKTRGKVLAILYGNEDSPNVVEMYAVNHVACAPTVWHQSADGSYVVVSVGSTRKQAKGLITLGAWKT